MKGSYQILFIQFIALLIFFACSQNTSNGSNSDAQASEDTLVYDTSPRWLRSEYKIIFYTYRHDAKGAELYSVNPDGSDLTRLTETYHNEWWSDASQNGTIYISSDYEKSERFGGSEIFKLDTNGDFTRITFNEDTSSFNIYPRVSPDGSKLLYCSDCIGSNTNSEVILMDIDGGNVVNLSNHPSVDKYGSWSPDGAKVLFQSNRSGVFQLYTLEIASGELTQLTDSESDNIQGDWSVNNEIVFISDRDGDKEVFVMNADGSDQRQITFNEDSEVLPSWSPDGKRIAFSSYRYGNKDKGDIFLINPDGTNEFRLTKK